MRNQVICIYYSVQDNTMVILFTAEKNFRRISSLGCVSTNSTHRLITEAQIYFAYVPIRECKWTLFMAACFVAERIDDFAIESIGVGGDTAMVQNYIIFFSSSI